MRGTGVAGPAWHDGTLARASPRAARLLHPRSALPRPTTTGTRPTDPPVRTPPAAGVAGEPLWHLVYRYWFWGWLFLDVNTGDLLRRAAAWRHNVRQRVHLPVYMRRWLVALVLTGAVAVAVE